MHIESMPRKFKLAILASHPIQYQVPFFKEISKNSSIKLKVLFCSDWGLKEYKDKDFGKTFKWVSQKKKL